MTVSPDGSLIESPYPFLPANLSTLPIYLASGDKFIVDDTGGQIMPSSAGRVGSAQAMSTAQSQAVSMAGLIDLIQTNDGSQLFQPNGFTPMIDTNGLWLEASNENNGYLGLRAHNIIVYDYCQLLSTTNLESGWQLGEVLPAYDTQLDFSPVPMTNGAAFFLAHQASPVMWIWSDQNAIEPNPTNNDPGQVGIFYIYNEGWATNDVTVYYSIGGTAKNGIDYSNLTGQILFPASSYYVEIDIDPIADGLKPDQTVILTLIQNTNYLIGPAYYSATNILYANPEVYPVANGDKQAPCPNTQFNYTLQAQDPHNLPLTYSISTWPAHGILTGTPPNVTYTPTNCYEGQDSFTFTASDGQFTSPPATVSLIISDPVYASPVSAQTCRGTPVGVTLSGGDNCYETLGYATLSNPAHGTLSGTMPNLTYTPTGTSFTGTDSFNFIVYSGCGGDTATNTATVIVGDENLYAMPQALITGTNQPMSVTLSAVGDGYCNVDTNYYTYGVTSLPANGTLSGTPPSLTYKPNTNYEGQDSFQFTASDGVWSNSATVTIDVTAGPILFQDCNPFGTAVKLTWMLDTNEQVMFPSTASQINDFIVYRSAVSGSNYTAIATNY